MAYITTVRGQTYIAELVRKGCDKLSWSVMPAIVDRSRPLSENVDRPIAPRMVPLKARRAARLALLPRL